MIWTHVPDLKPVARNNPAAPRSEYDPEYLLPVQSRRHGRRRNMVICQYAGSRELAGSERDVRRRSRAQ